MNNDSINRVRIEKDGMWYVCESFIADVSGGKAVIYVDENGREVKREALSRFEERARRRRFDAAADKKAVWLFHCILETAIEINMPVETTIELLYTNGLLKWALDGYGSFHQNSYIYMAEVLAGRLKAIQERESVSV